MKSLKLSAISAGIVAATLLLSTSAFAAGHGYKGENYKGEAAPCPVERGLQSGIYLGGQVGYDSYRVRANANVPAVGFSTNPALNATGFVGGLFAGYGQYFSDYYYLAGEVLGNYSGASTSWSVTSASGTLNSNFNAYGTWGLALLPGIKLNNDSLLYVRLGYDWTRLKASSSFTTAAGAVTSGSTSNWSGGFVYGLGLESLIYQNWSMRTEYSHTNNNNFSSNSGVTSWNPADNQFMVGLIYHFA